MFKNLFASLQKVGKSLMLPVSVLASFLGIEPGTSILSSAKKHGACAFVETQSIVQQLLPLELSKGVVRVMQKIGFENVQKLVVY